MCAMLKIFLVAFFVEEALGQYINHPLGAFSYSTKNQEHRVMGYSYVSPSGQTVNVKFRDGAFVQPSGDFSASPQFSAPPQPQYAFQNHPASVSSRFAVNPGFVQKSPNNAFGFLGGLFRAAPPHPSSFFTPANGVEPVASDKQLQAYNDDLIQLAEEAARSYEAETGVDYKISVLSDPELDFDRFESAGLGKK